MRRLNRAVLIIEPGLCLPCTFRLNSVPCIYIWIAQSRICIKIEKKLESKKDHKSIEEVSKIRVEENFEKQEIQEIKCNAKNSGEKHLHCCIVIQMLKSGVPLVESVRTQESQSRVHCVLAPRKKEITSNDQAQHLGIWEKEQIVGSALLLNTPFLSTFK